jgi:hypothetical protein
MNHLHCGFYTYNGKPYFTREDVFDDMIMNHDYDSRIKYYYNDYVFDKLKWSIEPNIDISVLYKMRAQQIRDKYDYVVLALSGGSDSTQVLWSFLKNNIFIDEIQVANLHKMTQKLDRADMLRDNEFQILLEYEFAALPLLKKVSELSPNTKITIIDASDFLYDQLSSGKYITIGNNGRIKHQYPRISSAMGPNNQWWQLFYTTNCERAKDKQSMCIVRGMEKPSLTIKNKSVYFTFTDATMVTTASLNKGEFAATYVTEDFFWSKDMPFIPIKQSHIIKKRLETDRDYYKFFTNSKEEIKNFASKNNLPIHSPAIMMERSFSSMIYPDWSPLTYAGPKPTKKNPEFKLYETVVGSHTTEGFLKEYRESKEKRFEKINDKSQFYRFIHSKPYLIGKLEFSNQ